MKTQSAKRKAKNKSVKLKILFTFITFGFCIVILHFSFYVFHLAQAYAEGASLGIYPPLITIEATPPARSKSPITIQNLSSQPVALTITLKPFEQAGNRDGAVSYSIIEVSSADSFFEKIKVYDGVNEAHNITLSPHQEKTLDLRVDVPIDEPASDYYFSVVFTTVSQPIQDINGSLIESGIATNVLLSIASPSGKEVKGVLEEFATQLFFEKGPVNFSIQVKNTGNNFIRPKGIIVIKNMFGQPVGKIDLSPVNILAHTSRTISAPNDIAWKENFLLGQYTASLTLELSEKGPVFTRETIFFGFPLRVFLGIMIAVIIFNWIRNKVSIRLE